MKGLTSVFELAVACSFAWWVVDVLFEMGLIRLIRERQGDLWLELGCPRASLAGYVQNSFSVRKFVLGNADRTHWDVVLTRYCSAYRVFNRALCGYLLLSPLVLILAVVHLSFGL